MNDVGEIVKSNSHDVQILLNIVNKEFKHLLHVENRTNIILAVISFLTITVVSVYVGLKLKFDRLFLIISVYAMPVLLIVMEYSVTKDFGVKLPSKGIISHRSLRSVESVQEYIERFHTFQKDNHKLMRDLSSFAVGLAIMAVLKKTALSIVTHIFALVLLLNISSTYLLYNYKEGALHLIPVYFIIAWIVLHLTEESHKLLVFYKKRKALHPSAIYKLILRKKDGIYIIW